MTIVERICPQCGASNASERVYCVRCGTNLIHLPAVRQPALPARLEEARTAALVIGASALILRAGLRLVARPLLARLLGRLPERGRSRALVERGAGEDDVVVQGWRTWSIQRGAERSSGSEQFEWRIRRAREG